MKPSLIEATLKSLYPIQRTVCLEGSPGGGKTSIVRKVAKDLNVPYIELHMPTMLVEDFGIPWPKEGSDELRYKLPSWFPAKGKAGTERGGILCFDDRNQASPDLQKVLANICQARTLHGVEMAEGWMVVSTGNRMADRAGANKILSHLRNRETVLTFDINLDDWCKWAFANEVSPILISFMRFRPGQLDTFDPQLEQNATPRSWVEGVDAIIDKVPPEAELDCFNGAVGKGAAAEFVGYLRVYRNLPDPDKVIENPSTSPVPKDPATQYAMAGALAHRATKKNFDNIVTYLERMPPEISVLTVMYALNREKSALYNTPAFTRWQKAHHHVLF